MGRSTRTWAAIGLTALALALPVSSKSQELITNGGFEAGFTGWTIFDQPGSAGTWYTTSLLTTPLSSYATVGPASGSFYAVTDQLGPGTHALLQSFTVTPGSTVTLSFKMFVNDWSGTPGGSALDYTIPETQLGRVDILAAGAPPLDTGGGVVANFFLGADPYAQNPNPYTAYVFDITPYVGMGGTYQLRFAESDSLFFLHMGVDDVSVWQSPSVIPEASTLAGLAPMVGFGLVWLRRRVGS